jgi:sec-independent protein translocase protein TatB
MFGVDSSELIIVAVLALIFIGPKELPSTLRVVGQWVGRARAHARHFTSGIDNMMREAELEEMEKRWREENERIMREHPVALPYAGASVESSSASLGTSPTETAPSGDSFVPSEVGAHPDEPPLPLPEPDHHRRELP